MYLLHVITLELRHFHDPHHVQYAALSHVWQEDDHKQTFRDIKDIHARCLRTREDPRSLVTPKVRQLCILAAEEGYEWVWIDTCCIDKSSSAELSEAINSMYAWYEAADVCYVFLFDAVVLSSSWYRVGTKATLASILVELTGIDRETLLRGSRDTSNHWKHMTSVAQRMSWAANRVTTRPEDRAYSLMGIFGVTMPVIYGEGGEQAFLRLQKEVINVCPDQTIFAWGHIHPHFSDAVNNFQGYINPVMPEKSDVSGCIPRHSNHSRLVSTSSLERPQ
ncbi:hypothetical protein GSI_03188 [Ganoderma sinense ZZ0214-1]|uniref:Uncharacterized protein n=1 Tax=Ganoderma sinense ZZ0214-1 TaxID=1077348 RepID=A0A2G8SKZ6_9APHY|nr:hypothetical protein GSI_03188 [Ganoderma sinense ZZ0214-1]